MCLEHYTAIIAEQLLREPEHQARILDDATAKLWLWHALEENEHKTVAYDVYEKVSGSYAIRAGAMIPTTVLFFAVLGVFQARMLASDGRLLNVKNNWNGIKFLFGRKGLFTKLAPQYLDFFKRDFHPSARHRRVAGRVAGKAVRRRRPAHRATCPGQPAQGQESPLIHSVSLLFRAALCGLFYWQTQHVPRFMLHAICRVH